MTAVAGLLIPLSYYRDWLSSRKNGKDIAAMRIPNFLPEADDRPRKATYSRT